MSIRKVEYKSDEWQYIVEHYNIDTSVTKTNDINVYIHKLYKDKDKDKDLTNIYLLKKTKEYHELFYIGYNDKKLKKIFHAQHISDDKNSGFFSGLSKYVKIKHMNKWALIEINPMMPTDIIYPITNWYDDIKNMGCLVSMKNNIIVGETNGYIVFANIYNQLTERYIYSSTYNTIHDCRGLIYDDEYFIILKTLNKSPVKYRIYTKYGYLLVDKYFEHIQINHNKFIIREDGKSFYYWVDSNYNIHQESALKNNK